eukprot:gene14409-19072_t
MHRRVRAAGAHGQLRGQVLQLVDVPEPHIELTRQSRENIERLVLAAGAHHQLRGQGQKTTLDRWPSAAANSRGLGFLLRAAGRAGVGEGTDRRLDREARGMVGARAVDHLIGRCAALVRRGPFEQCRFGVLRRLALARHAVAPGAQGANRTGRPFTGDYAGDLLYATLIEFGFATGAFEARPDDSLTLTDSRITNAVRCVPPQNKPLPEEIATCRPFLVATMDTMPRLKAIVLLGRVAHDTMLRTLGIRSVVAPFAHGA